jgi:RNA polymerase sigma factor (sigma-70 family)
MTISRDDPAAMIPMIRKMVFDKYKVRDDHDDLVQVGMVAICKATKSWIPGMGSFQGYAYQRAQWAIIDYIRRERPGWGAHDNFQVRSLVSFDAPVGPGLTLLDVYTDMVGDEDPMPDPFLQGCVKNALRTVNDRARQAWELTFDHGLNHSEAGRIMGISGSRVTQLVAQARRKIAAHPSIAVLAS